MQVVVGASQIVDERKAADSCRVMFNVKSVFYRLTTDLGSVAKKMIVSK